MSAEASVRDSSNTFGSRAAGVWSAANRYAVVLLLLVGIFCFFSLTQPDFFSRANLENLLTGSSILFVVSIGMTFVVLTGGIDLSVGSLLALSGIILSELFNDVEAGAARGAGTCLAAALLGGAINGVLIGRLGLSFFVVTLGTLSIYRGVVNIWSDGDDVHHVQLHRRHRVLTFLGIAYPIWIMLATYLVGLAVTCAGPASAGTSTRSAATSPPRASRGSTSHGR